MATMTATKVKGKKARKGRDPATLPQERAATAAVPQAPAQPRSELIPLAEIERDGGNHRLAGKAATKERIRELADSLRDNGQLQPVRVFDRGDDWGPAQRYQLAYGFRRCAAAELLGWDHIRAEIVPRATAADVERVRGVENLHRDDLNPVEEMLAVAQVMAAVGAESVEQSPEDVVVFRVRQAALLLGRPESWVRDRLYLSRLGPKVCDMVADGTLALGFAREIAKLGDHDDQKWIADTARVKEGGKGHADIQEVRRMVEQRLRSLRIVPWKLDAVFPRQKPIVGPCVGCPFNSATDAHLFENGTKQPEDGHCMKGDCFEAKQALCRKEVDRAVGQIVNKKLAATEGSAAEVVKVDFVKLGTVARAAKKQLDPAKSTADGTGGTRVDSYEDRVRQGEYRFNGAVREWVNKLAKRVADAARQQPAGIIRLHLTALVVGYAGWTDRGKEKALAKAMPGLRALFALDLSALAPFEKHHVDGNRDFRLWDDLPLLRWLADQFKVTPDPEPDRASFMPAKPGEKKSAAGKTAGGKKGRKGKKPVAARDHADAGTGADAADLSLDDSNDDDGEGGDE